MEEVTTIGLDLAKQVFQAHGARWDWRPFYSARRCGDIKVLAFFASAPALPCGDGSVRRRALLGPRDWQARP
jgi:hypothetical protein